MRETIRYIERLTKQLKCNDKGFRRLNRRHQKDQQRIAELENEVDNLRHKLHRAEQRDHKVRSVL